ncbi:PH domain-containing protein [Aeromicrobium massiliense]|uniref:PH domain-containing protein n=1 Tax=Aeromicrobium massiliense TaxID=1464554 RepID=UPI0002E2EEA3|nr:PH domain-containing protein [Aeromicrobium massiliense]
MSEREGTRTHPLTPLAEGVTAARWLAGIVIVGLVTGESWVRHVPWWAAVLGVLGLGLLAGGGTAAGWWFTRYVLDTTELRQTSGILVHTSRRVPYERIQSVDVTEPFLARVLGLAQLDVESAGGADSTTSLKYLPLHEAQHMRAWLLERAGGADAADHTTPDASDHADVPDAAEAVPALAEATDRIVVPLKQLVLGTLVRLDVALTTFAAVVLFAVGVVGGILAQDWAFVFFAVPVVLGLGQMLTTRIVQNWGFTLERRGRTLRIERGLLSRVSQTVPLDRVQGLIVAEPMVWRRLGWAHLEVDVAGYGAGSAGDDGLEDRATLLPVASRADALALVTRMLGGVDVEAVPRTSATRKARTLDPLQWKRRWLGLDDHVLVSRRGRFRLVTHVAPVRKIQSAGLTQGPLQRRLGLATLVVHAPPGPLLADAENLDSSDVRAALERLRPLLDRPAPVVGPPV